MTRMWYAHSNRVVEVLSPVWRGSRPGKSKKQRSAPCDLRECSGKSRCHYREADCNSAENLTYCVFPWTSKIVVCCGYDLATSLCELDAGSGANGRRWKPNSYPFFR